METPTPSRKERRRIAKQRALQVAARKVADTLGVHLYEKADGVAFTIPRWSAKINYVEDKEAMFLNVEVLECAVVTTDADTIHAMNLDYPYLAEQAPWKAAVLDELIAAGAFPDPEDRERAEYAIRVFRGEIVHPAVEHARRIDALEQAKHAANAAREG